MKVPFIIDLEAERQDRAERNAAPKVSVSPSARLGLVVFELRQAGMGLQLTWLVPSWWAEKLALMLLRSADRAKFERLQRALELAGIALGERPADPEGT